MPTVDSTIRIAKVISTSRISLPISTWIDGVRSATLRTRRSRKSLAAFAAHNVSSSSTVVLISQQRRHAQAADHDAERIERGRGSARSRPRILSAASVQANTATSR